MAEPTYNPNDPELLLSRSPDGDLNEDERRRLEGALGASPSLRDSAKALAAVNDLVRRWAIETPRVDADEYEDAVIADIVKSADDEALQPVDAIVRRWAADVARLNNEDAFVDGVLGRITPNRTGTIRRPWILRLGVPLTAAAAVIMAVTATMWYSAARAPVVMIAMGRVVSVDDIAVSSPPRVVIRFGRSEETADGLRERRRPISFAAVGSAPVIASAGGMPPL